MNKKKLSINVNDTNFYSPFIKDFLNKKESLVPFLSPHFSKHNIQLHATNKTKHCNRSLLQSYFKQAYQNCSLSEKQKKNIELLSNENTFTICAAHQPNIFLGPLFTLYKIIQCIKIADNYQQPYNLVPVFFIGDEDADFEELSLIHLNNQKFQWQTNERGMFGGLNASSLNSLWQEIKKEILHEPFYDAVCNLIETNYLKASTIFEATFGLINNIFKEKGLLILRANDPDLKKQFVEIIKADVLKTQSYEALQETTMEIKKKYSVQAVPQKINFFYIKNNQRLKIKFLESCYSIEGFKQQFSIDEMENLIEQEPQNFSPNVFLRAAMQEFILPNLVFVGGAGEIAYWVEMKKMFEFYGIDFPILNLRNSINIVPKEYENYLIKNQSLIEKIFVKKDEWLNELARAQMKAQNNFDIKEIEEKLKDVYLSIQNKLKNIAPHLVEHSRALEKKHWNSIYALEKKIVRSQKKTLTTDIQRIEKLKKYFYSNDEIQERNQNFISMYAKYGDTLLDKIYDAIDVEDNFLKILFL